MSVASWKHLGQSGVSNNLIYLGYYKNLIWFDWLITDAFTKGELMSLLGGQRTLQTPHTMQWAVRQQDTATGSTSAVNSTSARPPTSAVAATTTGTTRSPTVTENTWCDAPTGVTRFGYRRLFETRRLLHDLQSTGRWENREFLYGFYTI